jgi:hypothetical protein
MIAQFEQIGSQNGGILGKTNARDKFHIPEEVAR